MKELETLNRVNISDKNDIVEVKITNISTASFTDGMSVENSKAQYNSSCLACSSQE